MADISASYVSGNFINVGAFGISTIPSTYVSSTFLNDLPSEVTANPSFQILLSNFVGSQQLNIGTFGTTSTTSIFVSGTFLETFAYDPNVLPLTVGAGGQPVSNASYWLS